MQLSTSSVATAPLGVAKAPLPADSAPASSPSFTIAQFNVENFFPPGPNNSGDVQVTPAQYATKLTKLALAIDGKLGDPDVISLEEVGSQQSLDDLLAKTDLGAEGYKSILLPTNDKRGINVAMLYKSSAVSIDSTHELTPTADSSVSLQGSGGEIDPTKLFARPPLVVDLTVLGKGGSADAASGAQQLELVVNHLLAKLGGPSADPRRNAQGTFLGNFVDSETNQNPQRGVVLLGDFNSGYGEGAYNAMTTRPDGTQRLWDTPALKLPVADQYTYNYKGQTDMLDHMMVSKSLVNSVSSVSIPHFDTADQHAHEADPTTAAGVSDHDPILTSFNFATAAIPASLK